MISDQIARRVCALYYLDCRTIAAIAKELAISREDVRDAIDDPAAQKEYLQRSERARKRLKVRTAYAADRALERQVEFLQADVSDQLKPAQQRTAQAVLRSAMAMDEDNQTREIVFTFGMPELGMPPADTFAPFVEDLHVDNTFPYPEEDGHADET